MAKTPPPADAEFTRALIRAMVIEGVFAAIGVAGFLYTKQPAALIAPVVLGGVAFLMIFLPAFKAFKQREAEQRGNVSIVQDGGV